jgi:hypothetical protein
VAAFEVAPPPPLELPPLLPHPAAITDMTASPIAIVIGRLCPRTLFMCPPLKGS